MSVADLVALKTALNWVNASSTSLKRLSSYRWLAFSVLGTIVGLISLHRTVTILTMKIGSSPDLRFDTLTPEKNHSMLPGVAGKRELGFKMDVQKLVDAITPGIKPFHGRWNDLLRKAKLMSLKYMDLMNQTLPEFNGTYKNPCWAALGGQGLHCLPYFYLIGVKKSGTTSLFSLIKQHPDCSIFAKEVQWFPRQRFVYWPKYDGIKNYVKQFDKAAAKIYSSPTKPIPEGNQKITGEGTPANLHLNMLWRQWPGNEGLEEPKYVILDYIHHFLPAARMIIIFRDPVERLYSDYYHTYGRMRKYPRTGPDHFHKVVKQGLSLYRDCFQRFTLRSCVYNESLVYVTKTHIQLGIYHVYWEELIRLYPRDQIKIIHNEHYKENAKTTTMDIFKFLKLRPITNTEWSRIVVHQKNNERVAWLSDKGDMLGSTRKLLEDFYMPFNRRMAELTGDTHFLYTSS